MSNVEAVGGSSSISSAVAGGLNSGSIQFIFAQLQIELGIANKEAALDKIKYIREQQEESKRLTDAINSLRDIKSLMGDDELDIDKVGNLNVEDIDAEIQKTNEFVVNLVDKSLLKICDGCGVVSGREVDKFKNFSLTKQKGIIVNAPSIEESPVSFECVVRNKIELPTHVMFIGEIVYATAKEEWLQNDKLVIPEDSLVAYVQNRYVATKDTLGTYGYTLKK